MFFLSGVARYLFVPLAEAVVFAMLASYALSRTLIPTLVMWFYRKVHREHAQAGAEDEAWASGGTMFRRREMRRMGAVFAPFIAFQGFSSGASRGFARAIARCWRTCWHIAGRSRFSFCCCVSRRVS